MRRVWMKFANLFRGAQAEHEMSREIASHLTLLEDDFERRGMSPQEARLAAERAFRQYGGGVEQAKELHRETRSFLWVDQFFKDVRYGLANLRRNPGFTLTAVIALALGVGVNTTAFSLYNAIALKPLPVADPSRVVRLERWFAGHGLGSIQYNFAYTEYEYLTEHSGALSAMVAATPNFVAVAEVNGAEQRLNGYAVSANYFSGLGVRPQVGRTFLPAEDRDPSPVVVLDYRFWTREFNGAGDVIGRSISLNGVAYDIIGVAPREFTGTEAMPLEAAFYMPLSMLGQSNPALGSGPNAGWRTEWKDPAKVPGLELLARLRSGVSRMQAQAETDALLRGYLSGVQESDRTIALTLQKTAYFGNTDDIRFRAAVAGVLLVVGLVLLVACANVANMVLARGVSRHREIGIRLALGASRGRVIRQLLTESTLLSLLSGSAGLLISMWAARLLWVSINTAFQNFHFSLIDLDLTPDVRVIIYGFVLCLVTSLLFGLMPALQCTRIGLNSSMKRDDSGSGTRPGKSKLRSLLLGTQVTVSVALLVVAFAMAGTLSGTLRGDVGFETRAVYTFMAGIPADKEPLLLDRLEAVPELSSVAMGRAPLNGTYSPPMAVGRLYAQTLATYASQGYLETLGIPVLRGRNFTREEARSKAPVAVISESTARHFWPDADPVGKHFSLDLEFNNKFADFEVVGVARDAHFANIAQIDEAHVYLPSTKLENSSSFLFRVRGDHTAALKSVRAAIASFDPNLAPSIDMVSLEDGFVSAQRGLYRVMLSVSGLLTLLSLILAAVGIYGVMSFLVSQQTREIGIRVALGATYRGVIRTIVARGLRPVFIGAAIGFALGAAANVTERAFEPFPESFSQSIFGDSSIYSGLALMLAVAALASLVPARRALHVDPVVALRDE